MTTVTRTLLDLAAVVSEEPLEIALDDALHRRFTSVPYLRRRLEHLQGRGRRGCSTMRALLDMRGDGTAVPESILETKFRRLLKRCGLPQPVLQHRVECEGQVVRLDFAYLDRMVVIEVDGRRWHSGRRSVKRDLVKSNALNIRGWSVLRYTWEDVLWEGDRIVREVGRALGVNALFQPQPRYARTT